ncbi:MAG TPA: glycosyltransferase family 4 protein [Paucimonas sp.]|nr:glycosyltransferase family 4 protein [Paucimonas sp.]
MKILFVHQNFPAQYMHLAPALAAKGHEVVALSIRPAPEMPGVKILRYHVKRGTTAGVHPWASEFETKVLRGEAAGRAAVDLRKQGFTPDIICAHPAWGEALFLKDVWPQAKLLCFWEFYYHTKNSDVNFDPEFMDVSFDNDARMRAKNANNLLSLEAADWGVSPTRWQQLQFPEWARSRISVIHDGIDTQIAAPNPSARIRLEELGVELKPGDEVVTFVNRMLEPYRGYHVFMRSLPELQRLRPRARILIVGGEGTSYGAQPPEGQSWKKIFLEEVAKDLDLSRVHFVGHVPYASFLRILQISAAHVYLTYPFVLSWSLLEALSAGCAVIGSRTPPVEEVIRHGENGLLVDFFDHMSLAETIATVLADGPAYSSMRAQARADVIKRYDLQTVCLPRHIALVEALARGDAPMGIDL